MVRKSTCLDPSVILSCLPAGGQRSVHMLARNSHCTGEGRDKIIYHTRGEGNKKNQHPLFVPAKINIPYTLGPKDTSFNLTVVQEPTHQRGCTMELLLSFTRICLSVLITHPNQSPFCFPDSNSHRQNTLNHNEISPRVLNFFAF